MDDGDVAEDEMDEDDVEDDDAAPETCAAFCASLRSRNAHKSHFMQIFTGKMPHPKTATHALCQPEQSKCTWTCCKGRFRQRFTAQPKCTWTSQEQLSARIYR